MQLRIPACAILLSLCTAPLAPARPITVSCKSATEGYLLAEIAAQWLEYDLHIPVSRRFGMGGTNMLVAALEQGAIDIYPEYTGTIEQVIAKRTFGSFDELKTYMRQELGVVVLPPLGFNDTYTVSMQADRAKALGIRKISDLAGHTDLLWGVTHEFLSRPDGLPGLAQTYGLGHVDARGVEKSLAFQALQSGQIQVTDAYSTDGQRLRYNLVTLEDDRKYFPEYQAVLLVRADALAQNPRLEASLARLSGTLTDASMLSLNAKVDVDRRPVAEAARGFLKEKLGVASAASESQMFSEILRAMGQHIKIMSISLGFGILIGIPLGVLASRYRWLANPMLKSISILQTIPSIALLALMIPLLGIGVVPAVIVLFFYSLLPIVESTYSGLHQISRGTRDVASGMGLTRNQTLLWIELPLATRTMISGIRTSAVINVGTATLAALIGAGGLGDFILTGISLNDAHILMKGAIPAALLAITIQEILRQVEWFVTPRGLRR